MPVIIADAGQVAARGVVEVRDVAVDVPGPAEQAELVVIAGRAAVLGGPAGTTPSGQVYTLVWQEPLNGLHCIEFFLHLLRVAADRLLVTWDGSGRSLFTGLLRLDSCRFWMQGPSSKKNVREPSSGGKNERYPGTWRRSR